ncbi:glycosyltransferase family 4 protein [Pedobacter helvus]|uniref:Glycosyltransferase family 4 protein n=1 Tax=Pedobacter helvus TaxID=2563444 RepID=A0ABW9JJL7_9SPHI|nr:glycosyltransferase [Pedobacter ureilyticus]
MNKKTILATCYAVNPYKGSEDAMGWNFVKQIARYNNVIAVTRKNNRSAIEKYIMENPNPLYKNMSFLYFDLPYWLRFWKKGSHMAMVYYYFWQKGIIPFIQKTNISFDIAHNVNFHNDWTPSFLWKLNKPMVWGPVGHHPIIPSQYLQAYSNRHLWIDRLTWAIKKMSWKYSPALQKTKRKAAHIWCMNTQVPQKLQLSSERFSIFPSVASEDFGAEIETSTKSETYHVISAGRFVPLKGFDLTLSSFITFLDTVPASEKHKCKLTIVGSGPQKDRLLKIIREYKVQQYVELLEWVERKALMKYFAKASVFLFPSHEGAGMVVAEALSFGLPVICLGNEGPGQFINKECGFAIPHQSYAKTVVALQEALHKLYADRTLLHEMGTAARKLYLQKFTWESRGEYLNKIYNDL